MTLVAVSVGALSKPGVEIGIGSASRPLPSPCSAVAFDHDLVARRVRDDAAARSDARCAWSHLRLDFFDRHAHADAVDRAVGRDRADHDRHRVFAAAAVDDIGEQERLARRPPRCRRRIASARADAAPHPCRSAVDGQQQARARRARRDARAGRDSRGFFRSFTWKRPHPRNQLRAANRCNFYK